MTWRILPFLFVSCFPLAKGSITVYLDSSPESTKLQTFLASQTPASNTKFEFISLPNTLNLIDLKEVQAVSRAMAQEVTILPCIVFTAPKKAVTHRMVGTPKLETRTERKDFIELIEKQHQEALKDTKQSFAHTDAQVSAQLLLIMHEFKIEGVTARTLERARSLWKDESLNIENRQVLGLQLLHPALLREYQRLYKGLGDHSPETEALFLEAISVVEGVRDADPDTHLGTQAYEFRETLRKARLKAADFDS